MDKDIKISIAVPIHDMENGDWFLSRLLNSLQQQTFRNFEIVVTKRGKMAENTNAAIRQSRGELIKILYMDDYLAHPDALQEIVDNFKGTWLVSGCEHDNGVERGNPHLPYYSDEIGEGINTIGSPSVLTIRNGLDIYFNEKLTWVLDCELYTRLHDRFGEPDILDTINVVIGVGKHQTTHLLSAETKRDEEIYIKNI